MVDYDQKIRDLACWEFDDDYELMEPYRGDDPDRLARIEAFRAFRAELEKMPPEEVDRRYKEVLQLQRDQDEQAAGRNDEMAWFSQPDVTANFAVWCALEKWTLEE